MNQILIFVLSLVFMGVVVTLTIVFVNLGDKNRKRRQEKKLEEQQREVSNYELQLSQSGFMASKLLHFQKYYFAIDTNSDMINIASGQEFRTFAYKDLVAFEMFEDGQAVTSSSTGSAVAGGLLFGTAGAVVGSTMKKTTNVCNYMQLRIIVNDVLNPSIVINLISAPGVVKNGITYMQAFNFAKDVCATLVVIHKQSV